MAGYQKKETSDKLINAAIDLMAEKGYNGVTTQEIAEKAGFSEKTLFRHFQSKQNLLETAFQRYHYADEMKKLFETQIRWDLYADLLMIARSYHDIMYRNRKLIMIAAKDGGNLPGFRERTHKHPQQLKTLLVEYFETMIQQGKLVATDPETKALIFIYMNYGAAIGRMNNDPMLRDLPFDKFIEEEIWLFVRALKP
ncbi:TetR/AcrR family transcriptional regulator [Caldifermentibacillus hisashii]|uniref:TetR/AcrR family transcriptional regulator n=1 Tax=Caldifermentibacillus hisashii TaxID=996558 RepID=UPI001C124018|nr:TetR/AcrR family transcriptional regulator [Caldifermentibacillus hisashii]MBU5343673.1 TetR/AcrR family transcriptional regulator [Caldifermentibacillus hisashii]